MEATNHLGRAARCAGISVLALVAGLVFVGSASAAPRMYTGSLIIHGFGNDTTDGSVYPTTTFVQGAIPILNAQCNTLSYHTKETLTFTRQYPYTTPTTTYTVMFTVPAYGGATPAPDTNGDTEPDGYPIGCTYASLGDPLTGSGTINTTGAGTASQRTSMDPRGFALPASALNRVRSGASAVYYLPYVWEVHFADLHNDVGAFAKSGGDGSFNVAHTPVEGTRSVTQTAGKNQFGGVMSLLGSYGDNEGFRNEGGTTSVFYFDWGFDALGGGGQATQGGVVTQGRYDSRVNHGYTRDSGYPTTSTVYNEIFKWTTGTVYVTARQEAFLTVQQRTGYDNRNAWGTGVVQLVSPMLTSWVGYEHTGTAEIGIMKLNFVPEPGQLLTLGAGASILGLLVHRRRSRR